VGYGVRVATGPRSKSAIYDTRAARASRCHDAVGRGTTMAACIYPSGNVRNARFRGSCPG
jgi:hypothetical protein